MKRISILCLVLLLGLSRLALSANGDYVPGEILVKFKDKVRVDFSVRNETPSAPPAVSSASIESLNSRYGLLKMESIFKDPVTIKTVKAKGEAPDLSNIYKLSFPEDVDIVQIVRDYHQSPDVEYAEPNYIVRASYIPNDSDFSLQWGLNNTGQSGGLPDADIDAPEAWDIEQGSAGTIIAVLDTGVDLDHPDLNAKIVAGYDFVNGDNDPQDDNGHGTHIAGIIAAETNNAQGIAGVDWNASIMPIKVLNSSGLGSISQVAQGITYAATNGADIINVSLGTYSFSNTLKDAVDAASVSALIVAAAGNENIATLYYPAAFDNVLGVAASTDEDEKWTASNYGGWIDVFAPGVDIYATFWNDTYTYLSGTSQAAGFVSGIAGLLKSQNPAWSPGMLRAQIYQTADEVSVSPFLILRANANAGLAATPQPELVYVSNTINDASGDGDGKADAGETLDLIVTLKNLGEDATNISVTLSSTDVYITITDANANYPNIGSFSTGNNQSDVMGFSVDASAPGKHSVTFTLNISAGGGYIASEDFTLILERGFSFSGIISTDTEWTTGTLIVVTGNILVTGGSTLTIRPGVEVRFDGNYYLSGGTLSQPQGRIIAVGRQDNEILFTSNKEIPAPGDWATIEAWGPGSRFEYCIFEYGGAVGSQSGLGVCTLAEGTIRNCIFRRNGGETAIALKDAALPASPKLVEKNIVEFNSSSDVLWIKAGGGVITENVIRYNSGLRQVRLHHSGQILRYNSIYGNSSSGGGDWEGNVHIPNPSTVFSNNTILGNSGSGIFFENGGNIEMNNILQHTPYQMRHTDTGNVSAHRNYWGKETTAEMNSLGAHTNIQSIFDFYDDFNLGEIDYNDWLTSPVIDAPPFLWQVQLTPASPVGLETVNMLLTFSKDMIMEQLTVKAVHESLADTLYAGTDGNWLNSRDYSVNFTLDETTPGGTYAIRVIGAKDVQLNMAAPEDSGHTFLVDTAGAASRWLNAVPGDDVVDLSWSASSSPRLLGYNIYRSTTSGGPYSKVNLSIITTNSYKDSTVTNGIMYYYVYTVVNDSFQESNYSNQAWATPGEAPVTSADILWMLYH